MTVIWAVTDKQTQENKTTTRKSISRHRAMRNMAYTRSEKWLYAGHKQGTRL